MGRFDALTQIEEQKDRPAKSPVSTGQTTDRKSNLPANQQTSKPTNQQVGILANQQSRKLANQQADKPVNLQTSKPVNPHADLPANQQTSMHHGLSTKEKKKYTTYLREESITEIQIRAAQTKKKDHELLQEIIDYYLQRE
jgi:hypothetical protein